MYIIEKILVTISSLSLSAGFVAFCYKFVFNAHVPLDFAEFCFWGFVIPIILLVIMEQFKNEKHY